MIVYNDNNNLINDNISIFNYNINLIELLNTYNNIKKQIIDYYNLLGDDYILIKNVLYYGYIDSKYILININNVNY